VGKERAGCEVCRTEGLTFKANQLHPHHYIGRRNHTLRWDLRNRVWLCPSHHTLGSKSAHNDPNWFEDWMKTHRKFDWEYCNKIKNEIAYTIDYEAIIKKLEGF
jgi:hypothetical protein